MRLYRASRRELFERLDQPAIRPLPAEPFVYGEWNVARVNIDYHVEVHRHYYSVPYALIHESWTRGSAPRPSSSTIAASGSPPICAMTPRQIPLVDRRSGLT